MCKVWPGLARMHLGQEGFNKTRACAKKVTFKVYTF